MSDFHDEVKRTLAVRIDAALKETDKIRESKAEAYTVEDFTLLGEKLSNRMAAMVELCDVWEDLYGSQPTTFDLLDAMV